MSNDDISHDALKFRTSVGIKATIDRRKLSSENGKQINQDLAMIGLKACPSEHVKYVGSAAVHIYVNEILNQMFIVDQVDGLQLYQCPQEVASKAFDHLLQSMKEMYGHRRARLRSGF